jgi:hypothetical protein
LRLSVRNFADHLGLPSRTISRWEALGELRTPRTEQQRMLDTVLERATSEQRSRFHDAIAGSGDPQVTAVAVRLADVAEVRDEVSSLVSDYDVVPSLALLTPATGLLARVADLQRVGGRGAARRKLQAADAEVSVLIGQLIWDASQRRDCLPADHHFGRAADLAGEIGDAVTQAHAVLRRSFVALYGRADPVAGLALAMRAADISRPQSPTLCGIALLHVAEAQAMSGRRGACEIALDQARRAFDQRTELDPAAEHYTPVELRRMSGSCYLFLQEPAIAEGFLASARAELAAEAKVSSLALGNLGLARIRLGQFDAATETLHEAITALEGTRGGGGLNVVFAAGRELKPWRSDHRVQDVHDRLFSLVATA